MNPIRIFIASPSDVAEERTLAYKAIERLRVEFADRAELQSIIWEHEPLLATADFQSQIGTPANSDIFVMLLWNRFGSPLGGDFFREDGSRYASATEYEFEEAINAYREKGHPRMLVYRKTAEAMIEGDEALAQQAAVQEFFDKWFVDEDDTALGAYHTFTEPTRFEDLLELHLRKTLIDYLPNPNNLPIPANTFVGREALIEEVANMMSDDSTRLATLVGPGGTGKTRLSIQLGHTLLPGFRDGVFFVSLATVTDPGLVSPTIASTLGIEENAGSAVDNIIKFLKRKSLLLVIDNLEQVQSASTDIGKILSDCPGVKAIVTSRQAMHLTIAQTVRVPPLEVPDKNHIPPLDELSNVDAVRLFVQRAQAVKQDFELTDDNAVHVVDICRQVDALPLAIELAASRTRTMNPERLSKALTQRFKVLTGGADDLLAHQKSLRELIAWSYDLLEEPEQQLWRRLAVFAAGCNVDDAQEVCDPDDEYFIEVDVESLVDKSLVKIDTEADPPRISMLTSLREYALQQLVESPDVETIHDRFCDWCLTLGFHDEETATGREFENTVVRIDKELDNLRAALEYYDKHGKPLELLELAGQLYQYWYTRGLSNEGISWLQSGLNSSPESSAARGRALKGLCTLLRPFGRVDEARTHAEEALSIFEQLGDKKMQALILGELGALAQRQGELQAASQHVEQSLTLADETSLADPASALLLIIHGVTEHLLGNLDTAKNLYEKGLVKSRSAGDKIRTANGLLNLGEIAEAEGDIDRAYESYRESLGLWIELGHKEGAARCAEVVAGFEVRHKQRPYEAAFLFGAAEAIREEIDEPVESFNLEAMTADIAHTRSGLDEDTCRDAWNSGRISKLEGVRRHLMGGQETEAS